MHRNLILLLISLFLLSPASAEISIYWPGSGDNSISTADVLDITNGPDESVVFATSNGLSVFKDGLWTIYHPKAKDKRGYLEGIPLENYITCVEYDSENNLWLGYSDGIQIYDGYTIPVTLKPPQRTLISYSINDLQSLGDQMWVSTGDSGIYCYQNGEWKWFQPSEKTGLMANRITSMAVDYSTGTLVLASANQGQYILQSNDTINPYFQRINEPYIVNDMKEVRSSYFGGVYFFNKTDIVSYGKDGSVHILNIKDLSYSSDYITDLSSTSENKLIIGTNFGLYAWKNRVVTDSFSRKEIMNNQIKKVFVDAEGRLWFINKYFAGYYYQNEYIPTISLEIF
ncbi:MAG: hypothetical protein JXQ82_00335 [Methanomicrobiaceae archaeon]|nr:hypothetical protein [Methanomicrobiaceae archaeon]